MTQYVEQFPLPDPSGQESAEMVALTKQIYNLLPAQSTDELESRLNSLVWRAFGVSPEKVHR